MKKKQLSKLALMGLTAGVALTSTAGLSAHTLTETNGTYLAGSCGAGSCGGKNRSNPGNYTADTTAPAANTPVNPNMAPQPESMRDNVMNPTSPSQGSCGAAKPANTNGAAQYQYQNQGQSQGQGSCASKGASNQGYSSCSARR